MFGNPFGRPEYPFASEGRSVRREEIQGFTNLPNWNRLSFAETILRYRNASFRNSRPMRKNCCKCLSCHSGSSPYAPVIYRKKNYKQYSIDTWMPSRGSYGETHSSSMLLDFQARRSNIRYRDDAGNLRFCHTLNNTMVASPRILIPLLENHQQLFICG